MRLLFFIAHKGQFDRPVVRQVQRSPFGVVKLLCRKLELTRLGEISLSHAKAQIAQWIAAMSLEKLPAKVEQQALSQGHRGLSLRRGNAWIGRQQCVSAANGAREQRGGGECKARAKQIATSERKTRRIHPGPHGKGEIQRIGPFAKAQRPCTWDSAL